MQEKNTWIRLLTSVTGGVTYAAGAEVLETPEVAADLVQAGHAEYIHTAGVAPAARAEKAVSPAAAKEKR